MKNTASSGQKKRFKIAGLVVLLVSGFILRYYGHDGAMYFFDDQGGLLLVAYRMITQHRFPVLGPVITANGVSIPPFNYYLVAALSLISTDPRVIAVGYMVLNLIGCLFVLWYGALVAGAPVGILAFGLSVFSASMITAGRSIWEPHPTFPLAALYFVLATLAVRKRSLAYSIAGLVVYTVSVMVYPTPLLLLPFVVAYTAACIRKTYHRDLYMSWSVSIVAVFGTITIFVLPWVVTAAPYLSRSPSGLRTLVATIASLPTMVRTALAYAEMVIYDLFQVWFLLPKWIPYRESIVGIFTVATGASLILAYGRRIRWGSPYVWLPVGFLFPAVFGQKMYDYRFLPFYPVLFVALASWIYAWIRDKSVFRRLVIVVVLVIFVIGNVSSWIFSTLRFPRRQYQGYMQITDTILRDMSNRRAVVADVGVHYFVPRDRYDYFGSPIYYLLQREIGYPVAFTPAGNRVDRSGEEKHRYVYLVCDRFLNSVRVKQCLEPFLTRWKQYAPIKEYRLATYTTVTVFEHL